MFGLFAFLSTLAFVPHVVLLLGGVYLMRKYPNQLISAGQRLFLPPFKPNVNEFIILLILILSITGAVISYDTLSSARDAIPYILFFPLIIAISKFARPKHWNVFVLLVSIEACIGIVQFVLGKNSFFPSLILEEVSSNNSLLYYRRVFGLSAQSSILAGKLMISFILLPYLPMKKHSKTILYLLLLGGMFVTFNRTVILTVVVYEALRYLTQAIKTRYTADSFIKHASIITAVLILSVLSMQFFGEEIVTQMTRNKNSLELTGRSYIWMEFIEFIKSNIFFGNGGFKYATAAGMHAHNSFLQLLANQGIFVFILTMILIIRNINTVNLIPVGAILFYSLFQYGVFWGVSVLDIVFWFFLLQIPKIISGRPSSG